jgi:predicted 3-demethylubiquinone-9 3-methyltransferase (glyoxalase superfamily)
MVHALRLGKRLQKKAKKGTTVMRQVHSRSRFGALWHFDAEERGDIYFSLAHQGESCASVARRYGVSPSVIRRVFRQMVAGDTTFTSVSSEVSNEINAA